MRGTRFIAILERDDAGCIVLLPPEPGEKPDSAIIVANPFGRAVVDTPLWGVDVMGAGAAPTDPRAWEANRTDAILRRIDG